MSNLKAKGDSYAWLVVRRHDLKLAECLDHRIIVEVGVPAMRGADNFGDAARGSSVKHGTAFGHAPRAIVYSR